MRVGIVACCVVALSVAVAWGATRVSQSTTGGASAATREPQIRAVGLVWDDEFSGPAGSAPSPAWWHVETGSRQGTLQVYTPTAANVSVDGQGHLVLTARRTASGGYTSGSIQTSGRLQRKYGRVEARIEIPMGAGLWPTFWALGSDFDRVGWPQSGEIDIMENSGNNPFKITASIHGPGREPDGYAIHVDRFSAAPLANTFHVYGLIWRPNSITFTFDRTPYGTLTPQSLSPRQRWVFNQPFFLILNLAVGGQQAGSPRATRFPARMLIDWVRVYR